MKEFAELIQAIASLLYPIIIIATILIFKSEIVDLAKRLKKGKFLGQELELSESLDKLDESVLEATSEVLALRKSEESNLKQVEDFGTSDDFEDLDEIKKILDLAKDSPKLALISLAMDIEKEIRNIVFSSGHSKDLKPFTMNKAIQILETNIHHLGLTLTSLINFQAIRNRIIHGYNATSSDILRAIDSGIVILKTLMAIPRNTYIVYHPGVEIFSDKECKSVYTDGLGIILENINNNGISYQIFPTTKKHFEKGKKVAFEWGDAKRWGKTWYKDPDTNEVKIAWLDSLEFIGRNIEDI